MTDWTIADLRHLLWLLNDELRARDVRAEVHMVGGAVMSLVFDARGATRDIHAWFKAWFKPVRDVREAAARVAMRMDVPSRWLDDGVQGFLSARGEETRFLELSHLPVVTARAEYLLALTCMAMRLGEEFFDLDDVCYLLRDLDVWSHTHALEIVTRYFDA